MQNDDDYRSLRVRARGHGALLDQTAAFLDATSEAIDHETTDD